MFIYIGRWKCEKEEWSEGVPETWHKLRWGSVATWHDAADTSVPIHNLIVRFSFTHLASH